MLPEYQTSSVNPRPPKEGVLQPPKMFLKQPLIVR